MCRIPVQVRLSSPQASRFSVATKGGCSLGIAQDHRQPLRGQSQPSLDPQAHGLLVERPTTAPPRLRTQPVGDRSSRPLSRNRCPGSRHQLSTDPRGTNGLEVRVKLARRGRASVRIGLFLDPATWKLSVAEFGVWCQSPIHNGLKGSAPPAETDGADMSPLGRENKYESRSNSAPASSLGALGFRRRYHRWNTCSLDVGDWEPRNWVGRWRIGERRGARVRLGVPFAL